MSDLQCAATLLIARHGDREQSRELAGSLRDRRVAMVYSSPTPAAVLTAEVVAAELGVTVSVRDTLAEAVPGDGSEQQIADRWRAELESAADLHRGETVLFVSDKDAIRAAVPQLADNLPTISADGHALGACDVVELAVDADGWVLRS